MEKKEFSTEQLEAIQKLKDLLALMKKLRIHIASVSEYEVVSFVDAEGSPYVLIS